MRHAAALTLTDVLASFKGCSLMTFSLTSVYDVALLNTLDQGPWCLWSLFKERLLQELDFFSVIEKAPIQYIITLNCFQ